MDKCYGLLFLGRRALIGPHKYKTGCHGDLRVRAAILADENESRSAIGYIQDDGGARPRPDWLHSDGKKFTDWLVKILKPQLRTYLCRRKFKTQQLSSRINRRKRHSIGLKAEFGR